MLVNIAEGKIAFQSSAIRAGVGGDKAVDGNKNPDFRAGTCSSTHASDSSPWWYVDLVDKYDVRVVKVTKRGGCCDNRK